MGAVHALHLPLHFAGTMVMLEQAVAEMAVALKSLRQLVSCAWGWSGVPILPPLQERSRRGVFSVRVAPLKVGRWWLPASEHADATS